MLDSTEPWRMQRSSSGDKHCYILLPKSWVASKIYTANLHAFGMWRVLTSNPIRGISPDILTSEIWISWTLRDLSSQRPLITRQHKLRHIHWYRNICNRPILANNIGKLIYQLGPTSIPCNFIDTNTCQKMAKLELALISKRMCEFVWVCVCLCALCCERVLMRKQSLTMTLKQKYVLSCCAMLHADVHTDRCTTTCSAHIITNFEDRWPL